MIRPSERSNTVIILATGKDTRLKQGTCSKKENLPVDELLSILRKTDLQSISQEYNLWINSFELIRCHGNLRVDHFFEEGDLIIVYDEQLKCRLRFSLDGF